MNDDVRPLDPVDRALVRILEKNARLTHTELGHRVNLSRPAVHNRLKRLERAGVIRGYRAIVDHDALGLPLTVYVLVRTAGPAAGATATAIRGHGDHEVSVHECFRVTGDWSLLLSIHAAKPAAVETLIDGIRALPGVRATLTLVTLSALHERAP